MCAAIYQPQNGFAGDESAYLFAAVRGRRLAIVEQFAIV
jgi:hypothetical protein